METTRLGCLRSNLVECSFACSNRIGGEIATAAEYWAAFPFFHKDPPFSSTRIRIELIMEISDALTSSTPDSHHLFLPRLIWPFFVDGPNSFPNQKKIIHDSNRKSITKVKQYIKTYHEHE
jgi:hypothetical protein